MRKTLISMVVFTALLISSFLVSAHIFRLHMDKTEYRPGEKIIITLEIKNTLSVEKEMDIEVTLVEENDKYPPSAWRYTFNLQLGETKNITLYNTTVTDFMVNGEYTLSAQLLDEGFILYEDEVRFTITGLPETMSINLLLSNTSNYEYIKDVFLINEGIYIGYNTSVENLTITGLLIYPNNYTRNITLPYNFKANQTGSYKLSITAEKAGYKTMNQTVYFAVIGKKPFSKERREIGLKTWFILILLILIVTAAIIYKVKRR